MEVVASRSLRERPRGDVLERGRCVSRLFDEGRSSSLFVVVDGMVTSDTR